MSEILFPPQKPFDIRFDFSDSFTHENRRMFSNRAGICQGVLFLGQSCPGLKNSSLKGKKELGTKPKTVDQEIPDSLNTSATEIQV
ncbi:hypothetical protein TNCT_642161 [Trichonephila clavata]|uniref:Uncharacterized protein n=1 Tax=Trichonephila clavata TaxID=2740835 RepID=A0A8X6F3F2_TRICU|nr:hypothetical protein TNCT_642161 [Trichonephila clavata]